MKYDHEAVNAHLRQLYGATITARQLTEYRDNYKVDAQWIRVRGDLRVAPATYRIPLAGEPERGPNKDYPNTADKIVASVAKMAKVVSAPVPAAAVAVFQPKGSTAVSLYSTDPVVQRKFETLQHDASLLSTVPAVKPEFVPFGDYEMILTAVKARRFRSIFISGPSGNGKTFFVEQACAAAGREYVFCPITDETEEDDLIGGFRLKDGETVFEPGPVTVAALRGAVLLLDELDKAGKRIMILQSLLDGKAFTIKKLGIMVTPVEGFCVFATANTKGRGDETGRFNTSQILDEALLERFAMTVEQEYPSVAIEKKIMAKTYVADGCALTPHCVTFFDTLAKWAESIRNAFQAGTVEDVISTRRLVHIVRNYELFDGDDQRAIVYACNRFDSKSKSVFGDLYNKLAPDEAPSNVGSLDPDKF